MIESIPFTFIFSYRSMACIATCRFQINALIFPRPHRRVTCCIIQAVGTFSIIRVVVSIRHIVNTVFLMHPGSFMKICQSFHVSQRFSYFHHIIFQFGCRTTTATAIIEVSLPVIIYKHTRVNHCKSITQSFNISLHFKVFGGILAGSYTDFPGIIPVITTRMRKIKVISTVLICTIGRPHESTVFTSPRHL